MAPQCTGPQMVEVAQLVRVARGAWRDSLLFAVLETDRR